MSTLPGLKIDVKPSGAGGRLLTLRLKVPDLRPLLDLGMSAAASYGTGVEHGPGAALVAFVVTFVSLNRYSR